MSAPIIAAVAVGAAAVACMCAAVAYYRLARGRLHLPRCCFGRPAEPIDASQVYVEPPSDGDGQAKSPSRETPELPHCASRAHRAAVQARSVRLSKTPPKAQSTPPAPSPRVAVRWPAPVAPPLAPLPVRAAQQLPDDVDDVSGGEEGREVWCVQAEAGLPGASDYV